MSMRPDKSRQTLDHRSPECLWHGKTLDQAMDMWSVAVVVAYMCGHCFCKVGEGEVHKLMRQWGEQLGTPQADLLTGYPAWENDERLLSNSPAAARPWPPAMAIVLGESGQELLSSLFSYIPHERPTSSEVLEHPFMAVGSFPLMGVCPVAEHFALNSSTDISVVSSTDQSWVEVNLAGPSYDDLHASVRLHPEFWPDGYQPPHIVDDVALTQASSWAGSRRVEFVVGGVVVGSWGDDRDSVPAPEGFGRG